MAVELGRIEVEDEVGGSMKHHLTRTGDGVLGLFQVPQVGHSPHHFGLISMRIGASKSAHLLLEEQVVLAQGALGGGGGWPQSGQCA